MVRHGGDAGMNGTAVIVTALKRPRYLRETLESWSAARGTSDLHSFTVALGWDEARHAQQVRAVSEFRDRSGLGSRVRIKPDSSAARASRGMGRAIAEAADHVLADPAVEFLVFGEEDVVVSSDVLEYMTWAGRVFADDEQVLAVCAHSRGGQGWDRHEPAQDADADQSAVRLLPYFNAWCWGTWRDRWEKVLRPRWDMECDSGGAMDSGYDHHIHSRIIPQGGYLCAVPDASRSQNIGRDDGWASTAESFAFSQAQSFRAQRELVNYRAEPATAENLLDGHASPVTIES